ncbi:polysialic acid transporter [Adhaeribacter arboris]|uniref:Transport permease protein n=1 Tax=Adhaeribacter arboris TaxID=2072846 RepID=A0A2T2Y949_9BACT|nr:ABC transporter permease [Adhaeribacter arboris]PSR52051.1 polysialic acid transporter [Adhaeribacter arboris]
MSKFTKDDIIYTSDSEVKRFSHLIKNMVIDLISAKQLAYTLMTRDIKAQYRQSALGIIWAFIPAIATALTFTLASQSRLINLGTTNIPYPAYIIFSTALWQTFTEAVLGPINGVTAAKDILSKIKFPREALILAKLGEVIFNFGIKLILIIGVFIWYGLPVNVLTILAPFAVLNLILFGFGIGMLLAPLNVLYSDISKGITILLGFGLFLTPVVFPMPEGNGVFAQIVRMNPITYLLLGIRELTLNGNLVNSFVYTGITVFNIFLLLLSWLFYRLSMPFIVERAS